MTGIELPIYAAIGVVATVAGAGGAYAVTKQRTQENQKDIEVLDKRLTAHELSDNNAFQAIMRSLGRIEGTLDELKRSK